MSEPAATLAQTEASPSPAGDERPPDTFSRLWDQFYSAVTGPLVDRGPATYLAALPVLLAMILLLTPRRVFVTDMPSDLLIPLDGAWRLHHGQWPHFDFVTPVGSLFYAILGLAGMITGPDQPSLLAVANVLVALPVFGMTWLVTRDRLAAPLRAAALIAIPLCASSPRTLDSLMLVGFNAMYNRWCWSIAMILGCALLLPALRPQDRRRDLQEGGIVALTFLITFWIKVTFLPLLIIVLALSFIAAPENRRLLWGGLVGLVLTGLSALTPLGLAYLGDLGHAAQAASEGPGLLRSDRLLNSFFVNKSALLLLMGAAIAWMRTSRLSEERTASVQVLSMLGAAAAALLVGSQNHDATAPFLFIPLLFAWSRFRLLGRTPMLTALIALGAAGAALLPASLDLAATASHTWRARTATASMHSEGPLSRIMLPELTSDTDYIKLVEEETIPGTIYDNLKGNYWPTDYPIILQDAVSLLEAHNLQDRKITSLNFSPHFPYMLGSPPPRGLLAWADWQRTFDASWSERACDSLADTEVVLQPSVWNIEGIHKAHQDCLEREFTEVASSALWKLWVRPR